MWGLVHPPRITGATAGFACTKKKGGGQIAYVRRMCVSRDGVAAHSQSSFNPSDHGQINFLQRGGIAQHIESGVPYA